MTTAAKTAPMTNSVGLTLLAGLPLFTLLPLGLDIFLPAVYLSLIHISEPTRR